MDRVRDSIVLGVTQCHLCLLPIEAEDDRSVDHIVAYSEGGPTEPSNLVPVHRQCNSRKGSRTVDEYLCANRKRNLRSWLVYTLRHPDPGL